MFAFAAQLFGRRACGTNVVAGKENFVATAHTETAAVNCRFKGGECAVSGSRSLAPRAHSENVARLASPQILN